MKVNSVLDGEGKLFRVRESEGFMKNGYNMEHENGNEKNLKKKRVMDELMMMSERERCGRREM